MSTLKVDAIRHNSATSDAITTAADGTCSAKLTSVNGGQLSHRNIIINGAMNISQRGTSGNSGDYLVDRFGVYNSGTDETPTQAQVDVASGTTPYSLGFRKALKITNGNQTGGAGAADRIFTQHKVEAQDMASSGWNYTSSTSFITLSFWVKSSVAQNFYGYMQTHDGTSQGYSFETGSLTADTWTKVTKKIPGNSNLQFNNDNDKGLTIVFGVYHGTDYTDAGNAMNQWGTYSGSGRMPDNTTTWYTTNDATFEYTGVQLEVGDIATSFEHISIAEELRRCSRYCQIWARGYCIGNAVGSNDINIGVPLTTPLRAVPTCNALSMHRSGNQNASCTFHSAQYTPPSTVLEVRMGNWTGGAAVSDEVAYAVTPVVPATMIISAEL